MTLETFFEKFDQFADAPDAVAKMRELVLQLAGQGKLVNQEHDEGNVAQLLSAISRERNARAAKLRIPEEPASADDNGHAFQIPSNWSWTQLGKIALQIQYGYTASADPSATEIRMLRITDIQNNRVDWPSVPGCQIESDEAEKYLLSPNDILIARTGGTIGKSFIVPDAPVKSVFASYLIRVTPPRAMVAQYLKTFLESPLYWSQLRQMSAGTGQPNVNGQALGRLEIPLPPLAEQKRIVAKVDELMALCDRLEAQQQARETRHAALARASLARFADAPTPANLPFLFHPSYDISPADLRKSILTLAVQGKLVPQDPNDEPAEKLCEPDEDIAASSSFEVPYGWIWARLAKLAEINGGFAFKSTAYTEEGTRVVRISDFDEFGFKDHKVVRHPFSADLQKFTLEEQNILMAMTGGTVGKSYFVRSMPEPMVVNQRVATIKVSDSALPSYIDIVIRSEMTQEVIRKAKNSTNDNISMGDIKGFTIPLPPLAEQRRIVAKVEQLMALVDALETQLAASRATAANLLTALAAELTAA